MYNFTFMKKHTEQILIELIWTHSKYILDINI